MSRAVAVGERRWRARAALWLACWSAAHVGWAADSGHAGAAMSGASWLAPAAGRTSTAPHPAVVRVVAPGKDSVSYGSGTLVDVNDQRGLVITNWHVVNEATGPIHVEFPDGFRSGATVQMVDRDWDLAALAIWRPNVQPVPLAGQPPQPGERLTIAGYGSGSFRAASGKCTQYVAPGRRFPFEMVELAASARQGDSGGPIFNDRGELAGVLFGEGHGRTAGSYCGRVRWFLASAMKRQPVGSAPIELAQAKPASPAARGAETPFDEPATAEQYAPVRTPPSSAVSVAQSPSRPFESQQPQERAVAEVPAPQSYGPRSAPGSDQSTDVGWRDVAGPSLADQVKTVLAGIGVLALFLHALAWLGRGK